MNKSLTHVVIPLLAPLSVVVLYYTPVAITGCVERGVAALAVALVSVGAAFFSAGAGLRASVRGERSGWWLATTIILTLPIVLLVGPLG